MEGWLILLAVLVLASVPLILPREFFDSTAQGHPDGSDHVFVGAPLGEHRCNGSGLSYCRHWRERCECGAERVKGFTAEEVR